MYSEQSNQNHPRLREMPDIFNGADRKRRPATVTILRSVAEVYSYFRDFNHLPLFMKHLLRVEDAGAGSIRWTAQESGREVSWVTEMIAEVPLELLAWKTKGDAPFEMVAAVTFEPSLDGRATTVSYKIVYPSTLGKLAAFAAKFRGEDPDTQAATNLRRFKALLETGEIPTTEGQPSGRADAAAAA